MSQRLITPKFLSLAYPLPIDKGEALIFVETSILEKFPSKGVDVSFHPSGDGEEGKEISRNNGKDCIDHGDSIP